MSITIEQHGEEGAQYLTAKKGEKSLDASNWEALMGWLLTVPAGTEVTLSHGFNPFASHGKTESYAKPLWVTDTMVQWWTSNFEMIKSGRFSSGNRVFRRVTNHIGQRID